MTPRKTHLYLIYHPCVGLLLYRVCSAAARARARALQSGTPERLLRDHSPRSHISLDCPSKVYICLIRFLRERRAMPNSCATANRSATDNRAVPHPAPPACCGPRPAGHLVERPWKRRLRAHHSAYVLAAALCSEILPSSRAGSIVGATPFSVSSRCRHACDDAGTVANTMAVLSLFAERFRKAD